MIEKIGALAVEAMLYEVSATPKPGLVDRNNTGAHHDMDFFTFMSSAAALRGAFDAFAAAGYAHRREPAGSLLAQLQPPGQQAEKQMFAMTHGVNTHKGMIFSLGVLCGAAGWLLERENITAVRLCELAAAMCEGICAKEYAGLREKKQLTKGEAMYLKYGVTGVRGEAESGFQTVREIALPAYRALKAEGYAVNDVLAGTWKPNNLWGGFKDGMIKLAPLNPVIPKDVQATVADLEAKIKAGTFHPFTGPIIDQDGKEVVAKGKTLTDDELNKMGYYVQGVASKLPKK